MKNPRNNQNITKSKSLKAVEYVLLVFYLCAIVLRTIFTEGPTVQASTFSMNMSDSLYSMYISFGLFLSFVLWFVWNLCSRRFSYRFTGIEIGLFIFFIASIISGLFAADKRLVINNVFLILTPVLCAVVLVQILDSPVKIKLVLAVIAALGVLSAYQCAEQLLVENKMTIEQYEQNPQSMLDAFGIEPDTLQHFLFEHRLYTPNVKAYFTTRNSAGSFLLMSLFAAIALFLGRIKNKKSGSLNPKIIFAHRAIIAVIFFALFLTKSKGALIGLIFALLTLSVLFLFRKLPDVYKKISLVLCLLLCFVLGGILIRYGLTHERLPGGNSMLVRWQYWQASAKMYADYPLTGVGPGNFSNYYSHYKPAAALESVTDPHNFPLSILTQYGPLGLIGFLAMIFVPLLKAAFAKQPELSDDTRKKWRPLEQPFRIKPIFIILCIWLAFLLARLNLFAALGIGDNAVVIYILIRYYAPPVAVFIVSLLFLKKLLQPNEQANPDKKNYEFFPDLILAALLGVLLHGMTDYAIFEPGVFTAFWFLIACLIANNYLTKPKRQFCFVPKSSVKLISSIAALIICIALFKIALIPVAATTGKIIISEEAISLGRLDTAHNMLDSASEDDKLSSLAPSMNARLYLQQSQLSPDNNRELLEQARDCLIVSIERNYASFKDFERLSQVYQNLSEISSGQEKNDWLQKALDTAMEAKNRYPGSERLHFNLAQIAEKLGKTDMAIEHYQNTIDIENQYREQFRIMFPKEERIISRLGKEKYQLAAERLAALSNDSSI